MKNITLIITVILLSFNTYAQEGNYKVFPFKSGIVEYKLEGNSKGTHTKYFDKYGYKQADYTNTETTVFGFTKKEKKGTILIGPKVYSINYKNKTVSVSTNPVYESYANSNGADYDKLGRKALTSLGFSNTNKTENIAGKKCEIWQGTLGKVWIWKGLSLKNETTVLGVSIVETATSIKVNVSVPSSKFEIPKGFKVNEMDNAYPNMSASERQMMEDAMNGNMDGMMKEANNSMGQEEKDQIHKIANMSYSEFRKMMKSEEPDASEEEIKEAYQMTKQMAKYVK